VWIEVKWFKTGSCQKLLRTWYWSIRLQK